MELIVLRQTASLLRDLASEAIRRHAWDELRRFIQPRLMFNAMRNTGAIVSGSVVLRILAGDEFAPNDIDVYVPRSGLETLLALAEHEGYHLEWVRVPAHTEYGQLFLERVYRFTRRPFDNKELNILVTSTSSALMSVLDFDFTFVMNALTHWGIVCAYPFCTFHRLGAVNRQPNNDERWGKYSRRGTWLGAWRGHQ